MFRALISVFDKSGLITLASSLVEQGAEIVSTGGTAEHLRTAGINVTDVADITGFPEMLDGRVKTLHPKIHAGILADKHKKEHFDSISDIGVHPYDLVVVNLYPFAETIAMDGVTTAQAVENIDIGGVAMIRSAAKNFENCAVCVDWKDYDEIANDVRTTGEVSTILKKRLMAKAFAHTAEYESAIAAYFASIFDIDYPLTASLSTTFRRKQVMRYGENPHQKAALYSDQRQAKYSSITSAKLLSGKDLSYNNVIDADAAIELIKEFKRPAAAIIKHSNPCGCSLGDSFQEAFLRAREADPISAFGGIVVTNQTLNEEAVEVMLEKGNFFEVVIAPAFTDGAVSKISSRKGWGSDVRLIEIGDNFYKSSKWMIRSVSGGVLYQEMDDIQLDPDRLNCVTEREPTEKEKEDLYFAWITVKHLKSNAVVIVKNEALMGIGAGQANRVLSVKQALEQAKFMSNGAVLASDAFFPFPDSIDLVAEKGVTAIIQPGGSKKDDEVINACNRLNIAMLFTGIRHFKH